MARMELRRLSQCYADKGENGATQGVGEIVTVLSSPGKWPFVLVCAIAGAFAVPANATVTPVSSVVAALVGLLGLQVWAWSHLPQRMRGEPRQGVVRIVQPVVWFGLGLAVGLLLLGVLRIIIQPTLPSIGARIAQAG